MQHQHFPQLTGPSTGSPHESHQSQKGFGEFDLEHGRRRQRTKTRQVLNVLSFVTGLVFMVGGLSFLGQQNGWFSIDLGTVLPIVAIVGGLAAIFGTRRNE